MFPPWPAMVHLALMMASERLRHFITQVESLLILMEIFFSSLIKTIISFVKLVQHLVLFTRLQEVEAGFLTA
jgi:hypothetical protein